MLRTINNLLCHGGVDNEQRNSMMDVQKGVDANEGILNKKRRELMNLEQPTDLKYNGGKKSR